MILEEEVELQSLVGGAADVADFRHVAILVCLVVPYYVLHGFHYRHGEPGLQTAHEFTADTHVDARGVTFGIVLAAVDNLHIVDIVGDQAVEVFVVSLCSKFERSAPQVETVFRACHHLGGALRPDVGVERAIRVAHLAIECRLVI